MSQFYQVVIDVEEDREERTAEITRAAERFYGKVLYNGLEEGAGFLKFENNIDSEAPWKTKEVALAIQEANLGPCKLKFWFYDLQ